MNVEQSLAKSDVNEAKAKERVKRSKTPETLDEAKARILALKLDESEKTLVEKVFELWRTEKIARPSGRLSKKSCFEAWLEWQKVEHKRKIDKVIASKSERCWIVTDHARLASLEVALEHEDVVSLDVETTGLDLFVDRIVGIAGYFPVADIEFYVPFGHIDRNDKDAFVEHGKTHGFDSAIAKYRLPSQLPKTDVMAFYAKCLNKRFKSIWHNFDYDCHQSLNDGLEPAPPWWDTLKGMRLLNEHEESYALKNLHAKYVSKSEAITFEDLFPDLTIFDKDIEIAGIYAAGDGRKTYDLYVFQKRYIDTIDNLRTVWYEIEQPLLFVDPLTERVGMDVDLEWLDGLRSEFRPKLEEAERNVRAAFELDEAFNLASPQQLARLIYDIAGADPKFPLKFKKNERSTAAEVVDALCDDLPQLKPLLEYRTMAKLLGTYVEKIPLAIEPSTGRMHFSLKSDGTDTGRYSSSYYTSAKHSRTGDHVKGTNVQNIPVRTKEGVRVRMGFVPPKDWLFVGSDLSQIEPRVIAHILYSRFDDPSLKELFDRGEDIYVQKAVEVFGFDVEYCVDGAYDPTNTFKPRKAMKDGVLAYCYNQSPAAFARKQKLPLETANRFFESMAHAIPGLAKFRAWIFDQLRYRGSTAFSETLDGRKRRYPNYRKEIEDLERLERKCYNDGLDVYRQGGPRGRDDSERAEIAARIERLRSGTLTPDDEEAITRIGLYFRNKDRKDDFWRLRKNVSGVQRAAVNHSIQGTAADILKRIVIKAFWLCRERGWRFLFSTHDELKTAMPKADVTPENIRLIDELMTRTVELSVPLKCDTVIETRWNEEYRAWSAWDFDHGCPKEAIAS